MAAPKKVVDDLIGDVQPNKVTMTKGKKSLTVEKRQAEYMTSLGWKLGK